MQQSTQPLLKKKWTSDDIDDQSGKVFVITGANSGLGYEASYQLARQNGTVIMACRNMDKAQEAYDTIMENIPSATVEVMELDLSSFGSINNFAQEFSSKYNRLDVLINNAGIMQPPRRETEDGFELQFGVNHLGHFLLTHLLFNVLKQTPGARVVTQSSIAHLSGGMNFDDINWEESYNRSAAYSQSKMANLLFTYELDRKIRDENLDIQSVAVHPGYTATDLQQNGPTVGGKSFLSRLYKLTNWLMAQDVSIGTLPTLYAATASDVDGGDYFGPRGFQHVRGHPTRHKSNEDSYSKEDAKRLWQLSEEFTQISYDFASA